MYPIENYVTNAMYSACHQVFLAAVSDGVVPQSYRYFLMRSGRMKCQVKLTR